MEGACIYTISENKIDYNILLMYKEYSEFPGKVLIYLYKYNNCTIKQRKQYITTKILSQIIPIDAKHILTKMKYNINDNIMIELWKDQVYNKLYNRAK